MSALALSVVLSFVSAVAYAGGAIVQEQVAVSSPDGQYAPLRRPSWWAAVALNGLGGLLHVVALAYGPLSLVQPLGALTIVFALPMAALFVGRKAGATAWRGAIMATVGLAGLLSLVGAAHSHSLSGAQRVFVALVTGGAVVALMIAGRAAHRHPAARSVLLATASGIAFGMSSVFTKTVAVDFSTGVAATDLPSLAVIAVFAVAGVLLSQASYRGAGLAAPLATLTVVNPVLAAAVGITMFGESFRYGSTGTALALSCGVVAAGGLILLTTERLQRTADEPGPEVLPEAAPAALSETDPARAASRTPAETSVAALLPRPRLDTDLSGPAGTGRAALERALLESGAPADSGAVPGDAGPDGDAGPEGGPPGAREARLPGVAALDVHVPGPPGTEPSASEPSGPELSGPDPSGSGGGLPGRPRRHRRPGGDESAPGGLPGAEAEGVPGSPGASDASPPVTGRPGNPEEEDGSDSPLFEPVPVAAYVPYYTGVHLLPPALERRRPRIRS